jgi:hypothetical protein
MCVEICDQVFFGWRTTACSQIREKKSYYRDNKEHDESDSLQFKLRINSVIIICPHPVDRRILTLIVISASHKSMLFPEQLYA